MSKQHQFGFKKVTAQEKTQRVQSVFSAVASRYDVMNDFMSLGLHRLWKRHAMLISQVRPRQTVLDLAGGTGDLTLQLQKKVGSRGHVVLADLNANMLKTGRDRLLNNGITQNVSTVQLNAEQLPLASNHFDHVFIAFGFRNVTAQDKALQEMLRILKPGGQLFILEFSKPAMTWLEKLYDFYSFNIIPKLGEWVAKDSASYQYLVESIRMHPDQATLQGNMTAQGFADASYVNLSGGIVAIHRGYKPCS